MTQPRTHFTVVLVENLLGGTQVDPGSVALLGKGLCRLSPGWGWRWGFGLG